MSDGTRLRLAVIPARGGSKRVPRKNIRDIAGRPLISYTIREALRSELFDSVIVSSDSQEILDRAVALGPVRPVTRSGPLSDDHAPVSVVLLDALRQVDPTARLDAIDLAQLMPTCPLRTSDDILESYSEYVANGRTPTLSVSELSPGTPWWAYTLGENGGLVPLFPDRLSRRSQDLPTAVSLTGAVWWVVASDLANVGSVHELPARAFVLSWPRGLDIDDEDDWKLAELMLGRSGAE